MFEITPMGDTSCPLAKVSREGKYAQVQHGLSSRWRLQLYESWTKKTTCVLLPAKISGFSKTVLRAYMRVKVTYREENIDNCDLKLN